MTNFHAPSIIMQQAHCDLYIKGGATDKQTHDNEVINLIYYKDFANSWWDFISKYKTLKLLNFYAKSTGQTGQHEMNSYSIPTENISLNVEIKVFGYESKWLFGINEVVFFLHFVIMGVY